MALDIKKLKQKRHDAKVAAETINNAALAEGMTAEQQTQFDAHMETIRTCDADIKRAEALIEADRTAPAAAAAIVGHNNNEDAPFESLAQQMSAIRVAAVSHGRTVDARLYAALGANETIDSDGGFLVQPEFGAGLITRIYDDPAVLSRVDSVPMSSARLVLNGLVDNDRSTAGGRFAGMQVYRIAEAAAYAASKPKFRKIELNANKLIAMFYATEELLADAPAIENRVGNLLAEAFPYQMTDEIFAGSGEGQMLGIQTSGAQVVVAKEAGQAAASIVANNVLKMWAAMPARNRRNAVWYIQQDLEVQLYPLTLGTGTAVQLMYTPPGMNGNTGPYGLLLGRPVIPVEQAATVGAQGDIMLYDLGEYLVGSRQGLRADSSIHVAFNTGEQAFRWMMRNDGQPKWDKPLTPRNSTQLRSPFVTLATRG